MFRADLYYRLNEFTMHLPPLRERREDIPHLATRFLKEAAMELKRPVRGFSPDAEAFLIRHAWPGNVRELRNVVRRAVLLASDMIDVEHVDSSERNAGIALEAALALPQSRMTLREARDRAVVAAERHVIQSALKDTRGNKSEAARLLKTDYKTLHLKIKEYGIRVADFTDV